jgi:hypothetical protein
MELSCVVGSCSVLWVLAVCSRLLSLRNAGFIGSPNFGRRQRAWLSM